MAFTRPGGKLSEVACRKPPCSGKVPMHQATTSCLLYSNFLSGGSGAEERIYSVFGLYFWLSKNLYKEINILPISNVYDLYSIQIQLPKLSRFRPTASLILGSTNNASRDGPLLLRRSSSRFLRLSLMGCSCHRGTRVPVHSLRLRQSSSTYHPGSPIIPTSSLRCRTCSTSCSCANHCQHLLSRGHLKYKAGAIYSDAIK